MNIQVRSIGIDASGALHDYATRRVLAAVGRLLRHDARVAVHLSDDNGPRGGVDKRCRISVHALGRDAHVEAADADPYAAVDQACDRLVHAIQRRVERARHLFRRAGQRARWQRRAATREAGSAEAASWR